MTAAQAPDRTPRPILVAVAWPYANGLQHLGHIVGAYLPADIFARYHRIAGDDVLMVSGSDGHGTPITVRAREDEVEPEAVVERFHATFLEQWERLGISFDLFTTTLTDNHAEVTRDVFGVLRANGHIDKRSTEQLYDPVAEQFLPDRYVEGTCPHCGYDPARGDQCDNCGRTLTPVELVEPRSKLSGAAPQLRATEHFFLRLSDFQDDVLAWLEEREGWRPAVQNWARGFVGGGLHDNAITRDLEWGVELPPDAAEELGPGKRLYVWFDAVIGYLSASKEWAQRSGDAEAWRRWWQADDAESYYFIGKDNIPFHAVYWPIYLMGYGGLNLPTDVPANQYLTFKGSKASTSMGVGRPVLEYLDELEPDALRYALAASLPEQADTDFSDDDLPRLVNDELIATWGNLVNRTLSMTAKHAGAVPEPGTLDARDRELLAGIDAALEEAGAQLEAVRLRQALRTAFLAAQDVNAYLNEREPWRTAKTDMPRTLTTLWTTLQAIAGLTVAFAPFLPHTCAQLDRVLGGDGAIEGRGWARRELTAGTPIAKPTPLFTKLDVDEG